MKIGWRSVGDRRPMARPILLGIAIALGMIGFMLGPHLWTAISHRYLVRQIVAMFLEGLLGLYLTGLIVSGLGVFFLTRSILRARRRRERATSRARALAACVSFLIGALLLEGLSAAWLARAHRIAPPEPRYDAPASPGDPAPGDLYVVVLGESTALGSPFDPWLSIGQIVGWKLESVFPSRRVVVDIRAVGGFNLERSMGRLARLPRRPDAILLYCGHNEFQAFYRLSRAAVYYLDEVSFRSRATRRLLQISPLSALIFETIERHQLDELPERSRTRNLVESPACTPEERERILDHFRGRLNGLVDYCEKAGVLPIVFVPAGNDGGFDPSRSVLSPETSSPAREAFARAFREARTLEVSDPEKSTAAYRSLLAEQPDFAEAHFRLARLLERKGAFEEANEHFVEARDHDALPLRCASDFRAAVLDLAKRKDCVVIDAEDVLRPLSPHGIFNEQVFLDAHHPNLTGYVALSREVLKRLQARRAFGWPADMPPSLPTPAEVAGHFGFDSVKWVDVCRREQRWYQSVDPIRFDPSDRVDRMEGYARAADAIAKGLPPEDAGLPGIGVPKVADGADR